MEREPVVPVRTSPLFLSVDFVRDPQDLREGEIDYIRADAAAFGDFDYISRGRGVRGDPPCRQINAKTRTRKEKQSREDARAGGLFGNVMGYPCHVSRKPLSMIRRQLHLVLRYPLAAYPLARHGDGLPLVPGRISAPCRARHRGAGIGISVGPVAAGLGYGYPFGPVAAGSGYAYDGSEYGYPASGAGYTGGAP